MNDLKYDCFISTLLYLFGIWNRKELIKPILFLTYGFHYNSQWQTLDDTIVYSYLKEDILAELSSCGIHHQEKDISVGEWPDNSTDVNEVNILVVDGFECPWHQAYQTYHVNHHLVLKHIFQNRIMVVDPFFEQREFEFEKKTELKQITIKNVENKRDVFMPKREINKVEYMDNIDLFCDNLFRVGSQLLNCDMKLEGIQFLRDIKSILYSKYNLMAISGEKKEVYIKRKDLINQWETLLNRLIYITLTKKIQEESIDRIKTDIKKTEREIIHYL